MRVEQEKENRKCGICHIGTGSDGREKKLGRCCHDPGGNYDLCASLMLGGSWQSLCRCLRPSGQG